MNAQRAVVGGCWDSGRCSFRRAASVVATLLSIAVPASPGFAHEGVHNPEIDDAEHVEAFLDGVINTAMYQRNIPGAVLTIVKDGEVFINKGYGFANAETKTPVDPGRTLFRIASVTKTINATAVMQLAEQGKLDLNGEVGALLTRYGAPLTLAEHFPQKVRLLDLMNHTAGFDERAIGMARLDRKQVPKLGAYLTARMPPQVMAPRTTISYSNHGVALSGYLVELASGQPYCSYVRDHVLAPLGMTHTSMEWDAATAADIAQGYQVAGGKPKPVPFDHICMPAAGGGLSCGADMARFMIAHLQNGRIGETRVLAESTAIEMHRTQYEQDPRLEQGLAVAFFTGTKNGHRYLEHGGDLNGFASRIWLLPDDGIGIFTSCNVDDGALRGAIVGQFMDRYFPVARVEPKPDPETAAIAKRYVGAYRSGRYAHYSIEKLATLMEQFRVTVDDGGMLNLASPGGPPERLVPVANGVFEEVREGGKAVFRTDNNGAVTHMLIGEGAFERLRWYEETRWQFAFLGASLLMFASAVVCWPVAWARRRRCPAAARPAPRYYRVTAWCTAALALYVLVTLGATMMALDKWEFTYGMPSRMVYLLTLPPVVMAGSALLALNTLAVWWRGYWSAWARLHYTLVAAACAALGPFFVYWNLLGFNW